MNEKTIDFSELHDLSKKKREEYREWKASVINELSHLLVDNIIIDGIKEAAKEGKYLKEYKGKYLLGFLYQVIHDANTNNAEVPDPLKGIDMKRDVFDSENDRLKGGAEIIKRCGRILKTQEPKLTVWANSKNGTNNWDLMVDWHQENDQEMDESLKDTYSPEFLE